MRKVAVLAQASVEPLLEARTELDADERVELLEHIGHVLEELWGDAVIDELEAAA